MFDYIPTLRWIFTHVNGKELSLNNEYCELNIFMCKFLHLLLPKLSILSEIFTFLMTQTNHSLFVSVEEHDKEIQIACTGAQSRWSDSGSKCVMKQFIHWISIQYCVSVFRSGGRGCSKKLKRMRYDKKWWGNCFLCLNLLIFSDISSTNFK